MLLCLLNALRIDHHLEMALIRSVLGFELWLCATSQASLFYILCLRGYALCRRPLLAPRGCHLGSLVPAFGYPGVPFWHLRGTLEDHGLSGMDTRWAEWDGHELEQDFH